MPAPDIASSTPPIDTASQRPKLIALRETNDISPRARAVAAAADIVFCEDEAYGGLLALVGSGTLVEIVSGAGKRAWSIGYARKLAAEGWRVVWVAAAEADDLRQFEPADGIADAGVADPAAASVRAPHPLATPFNGLAG